MEQNNFTISEKQGKAIDAYPKSTMPVVVSTIIVVVLTAAIGGVLMWFSSDLNQKIASLNNDIASVQKEMTKLDKDGDLVNQSKRLTMAVKTFNKYEEMDLDWMRFLDRVKENTLAEVTYSAFSIDRKKGSFRVDGVAPSYRVVAEQLNVYMNDPEYKQAELTTAVLRPESESKSRVAFSIELTPTKEAFMAEQKTDQFDLISTNEAASSLTEGDLTK